VAKEYDWQADRRMTAKQYRTVIGALGLNVAQAGRYLGISERTSHRYIRGEAEIPEAHALLLRALYHAGIKPLVPEWVSDRLLKPRKQAAA
jgi:hypothetical protein